MNCTTRRPARSQRVYLPHFGNIVNELLNTPVNHVVKNATKNATTPAVNVIKAEDRHIVELAVPGHSKKDINITIDNDILTIKSIKEKNSKESSEFRLREFDYTGFERSFTLPETVDQSKVDATFKDGLLTLTLLKKEEAIPQPAKTIKIK
tara:strand:+ start:376 stop:828 length:453 start_codon:yes stop_codon:yes gene_type:complete